ncbi:hypothetical protein J7384_05545 [Endozoicomonas sp. G2_1]|uniref:LnmK family bifunctional acyltransferase/decarboxylase n=1 Tax=Endozoicomonas sp. G2_1 TaxID=2821091 RepID=UPI001AD95B0E|nr:LnmK family bifunctional acyltransferase/decarboxylase [Endozoicomonas sp. G2_1]MBO9489819.1 hypothetical protein [Endozoicomonas sp. G2_1]
MSVAEAGVKGREMTLMPGKVIRQEIIKPSMCGHNSLFVGRVGDWTWDAVNEHCGVDVYNAHNEVGAPTYLSFFYYHIKANEKFHLGKLTFGDLLNIQTQLFSFGSESILTLHKIEKSAGGSHEDFSIQEFYESPKENSIYIQNFNRWIARTAPKSNENLVKSSPIGFDVSELPVLPVKHSPRAIYDLARRTGSFLSIDKQRELTQKEVFEFDYEIDVTRDLNGVGLLYFASYFSIVDKAIWQTYKRLDRDKNSYLERIVLDHKICFVSNANFDSILSLNVTLWQDAEFDYFNVVIKDSISNRNVAIATVQQLIQGN